MEELHSLVRLRTQRIRFLYESFLTVAQSALMLALNNPKPLLVVKSEFNESLSNLFEHTAFEMSLAVQDASDEIAATSVSVTFDDSAPDVLTGEQQAALEAFTDSTADELAGAIHSQMQKDVTTLFGVFRQYHMSVVFDRSQPESSSRIAGRERFLDTEFYGTDVLGRRQKSTRYLNLLTARSYMRIANVIAVYVLSAQGASTGKIYRPGHERHEATFPLDLYETMESVDFHPNSFAIVTKG